MNKKEKLIKESLIKAVSSVRKKFRTLHNARAGQDLKNDEIFKPITGKLDALIDVQNTNKTKNVRNIDWNPVTRPPSRQSNKDDEGASTPVFETIDQNLLNQIDLFMPSSDMTLPSEKKVSKVHKKRYKTSYQPYSPDVKLSKSISKKYKKLEQKKQLFDAINKLAALQKNTSQQIAPESDREKSTSSPHQAAAISVGEEGRKLIIAKPKQKKSPSNQPRIAGPSASRGKDHIKKKNEEMVELISSDEDEDEDNYWEIQKAPAFTSYLRKRVKKYAASPKYAKRPKEKETVRDLNVEQQTETRRRRHTRQKDKTSPPSKSDRQGSGMISTDLMRYDRNKHVSYTYWDNPNELVDRLRLLIASQSAGNTGHTNEIVSIVEELREANIIH